MQTIAERLDGYPAFLAPLADAGRRYLKYPSVLTPDGIMDIGHRPWVAKLNYMLMLYPSLNDEALQQYSKRFNLQVPAPYAAVLRAVNGAFCFGMSLCGVPPSMLGNPPLLERRLLQCHDLAMAATMWAREYRLPPGLFHFGSRDFSRTEKVGYFMDGQRIRGFRKTGEQVGEWGNFTEFLAEELRTSEQLEEQLHPSKWPG